MMSRRLPLSVGIALVAGVAIGWGLAGGASPRRALANGGDRWGDRALAVGPVSIEAMSTEINLPLDAIYYLNYSTGKILATIPTVRQFGQRSQVISDFAERDLLLDFGIKPGMSPHFLMTTASVGSHGSGWSPLVVVETETGQIATYKVAAQVTPGATRPTFQLIDKHTDVRLGRAIAAQASR